MGHGAAYYWKGKNETTQFFSAIPFGMTATGSQWLVILRWWIGIMGRIIRPV